MLNNTRLLESSIERVARILTDRYDIRVVFDADKIMTDNRTIYLPFLPEDCPEELYQALQGYLDHEAAHIIFDDFSINPKKVPGIKYDSLLSAWFRLLSDIRIEHKMGKLWPGSKRNLNSASSWTTKRNILPKWDQLSAVDKCFKCSFLYGMKRFDDLDLLSGSKEILKKIEPIKVAIDLASQQPDVLHILALAKWIVDVLRKDKTSEGKDEFISDDKEFDEAFGDIEEEIKKTLEDSPDEEEGEEGSSEGTEGEEGSSEGAEGAEGSSEGTEGEEGSSEGTEGTAEDALRKLFDVPDRELDKIKKDLSKRMVDSIKKGIDSYKKSDLISVEKYIPFSTKNDKIENVLGGDFSLFAKDLADVRKTSGVLTRRLRSVLLAKNKNTTQYDKLSGKLNKKALPSLIVRGNQRIFKTKVMGQSINCRMILLIDQSGSMMRGNKILYARRSAILFGEFNYQLNIPFEILGFTSSGYERDNYNRTSPENQKIYARWGNLCIYVYKQFHELWPKVGNRLSNLRAEEENYDGESLIFAAKRLCLAKKPNERLILFVLSDGYPQQSIFEKHSDHVKHLHTAVEYMKKINIECIGIGICTDSVREYYPNWVVVNDPSNLEGAQIDKLKEIFKIK